MQPVNELLPGEWSALLRKRAMWEVHLFVWSLPINPARLAEIRAQRLLDRPE